MNKLIILLFITTLLSSCIQLSSNTKCPCIIEGINKHNNDYHIQVVGEATGIFNPRFKFITTSTTYNIGDTIK